MSIETMKLALEALEDMAEFSPSRLEKQITDLRQAIEQAQKQEPVAGSNALMLANWLQANYEADEIDESAEELRKLYRENQLLWQEREEPHKQLEFYIRECNRLEAERDAALKTQQAQKPEGHQEPVTYPENFIDALRYDTALREFEPPQRQWVDLTDDEEMDIALEQNKSRHWVVCEAIRQFKEKNT